MNYEFRKIDHSYGALKGKDIVYDYGVTVSEDKFLPLEQIEWWGWTPEEVQMIIDNCNNLNDDEDYEYQVEGSDLLIIVDKEEADLIWTYNEFIAFMEKFKLFIEKNS